MASDALNLASIRPSAELQLAAAVEPTTPPQSPLRRQRFPKHEIETLLSDLSPDVILDALLDKTNPPPSLPHETRAEKQNDQVFIRETVANASPPEKSWGIRAAQASKKIREWHDEFVSWPWPKEEQVNGFQAQYNEEHWAKGLPSAGRDVYRASIPSSQIREYENRVETIKEDMDTLDVEDLKSHLRDAHVTPRSRRRSLESTPAATSYDHMDDFTALITATIVQSLPTLARLCSLLNSWSIRLVVLRLAPDFLRELASCKESMVSGQMAIGTPNPDDLTFMRKETFTRNVFADIQAVLKDQIFEVGKQLDSMLDLLEGSQDVLPEQWIDSMDQLENEYSSWVVKAEEVVLANELAEQEASLTVTSTGDEDLAGLGNIPGEATSAPLSGSQAKAFDVHGDGEGVAQGVKGFEFPKTVTKVDSDQPKQQPGIGDSDQDVLFEAIMNPGLHKAQDAITPQRSPVSKLKPLVIEKRVSAAESNTASEPLSVTSRSASDASDLSSNAYSPELRSATLAAYPGSPVQVTTPSSRRSGDYLRTSQRPDFSQRNTRQSWNGMPGPRFSQHQRKRSSTFTTPEPSVSPARDSLLSTDDAMTRFASSYARPRSASIRSFEVVPRSEIRQVEIRRSVSHASSSANLPLPNEEGMPSGQASALARLQGQDIESPDSTPATFSPNTMSERGTPEPEPILAEPDLEARSETSEADSEHLSIAKVHDRFGNTTTASDLAPMKNIHQRAATFGSAGTPFVSRSTPRNGDRLEAKISSILTDLPTSIRLTSAAEPRLSNNATPNKTPNTRRKTSISAPLSRLIRSRTTSSTPTPSSSPASSTTITPVSTKSNTETDIKLYHLHQPGQASPIKLYVRLVGVTNERAMVRIGGGWADLSEYLKEYASHHGKRTVSEGHFNIHALPATSSPAAGHGSRPSSSSSNSGIATSGGLRRQKTTPASIPLSDSPSNDPPRTPPYGSLRPSSRGTWSGESDNESPSLGLAGPKTRKMDISPRKQAWVDGMMKQARTGAGERDGKMGGVKRVFLRGRKESM